MTFQPCCEHTTKQPKNLVEIFLSKQNIYRMFIAHRVRQINILDNVNVLNWKLYQLD